MGCVGSIRLWSLTLRLWWDGLTNSALHAFPESTCLRAVLRWRIWVTPLKGERRRQKIRLWHAANLTCVNSLIPTFQYRAEVCGTVGWEQQMGKLVTTLIIEPRSLVREGLVSLMASHSYHVVGGVASTADIDTASLVADVPKLVILGALPAEKVTTAARCIRDLWPEAKIVVLFERASSTDYQNWQASEIDGCIPLSVSTDVLSGTLQRILDGDLQIMLQEAASRSAPRAPVVTNEEARNDAFDGSFSIRVRHGLSEREEQILKSVVKGHGNKIIARTLDIAEATVKVHMKSVLRKIRVANRTQAAIWALENGYAAGRPHPELPRLEAVQLAPLSLLSPSAT